MQTWCCPHMVCKFKPPFQGQNYIFATLSLYQSYGGLPSPLKAAGCNEEIISFNLSISVIKAMFKAIVQSKWLWRTFRNFWAQITWCYLVTWPWVTWIRNFHKVCGKDVWTTVPKTAALRAAVFQLSAKILRGGGGVQIPPPGPAWVNRSDYFCLAVTSPKLRRMRWSDAPAHAASIYVWRSIEKRCCVARGGG